MMSRTASNNSHLVIVKPNNAPEDPKYTEDPPSARLIRVIIRG